MVCARHRCLMKHSGENYFQALSDEVDPHGVAARRECRLGIPLLAGSCFLLFSIIACSAAYHADRSLSLISLSSKSDFARSRRPHGIRARVSRQVLPSVTPASFSLPPVLFGAGDQAVRYLQRAALPWLGFRGMVSHGHDVRIDALASPDDEPVDRNRSEAFSAGSGEGSVDLDAPMLDDDGLMASFKKRLEREGGAEVFRAKAGVSEVKERVEGAQRAVQETIDPTKLNKSTWWRSLSTPQRMGVQLIGSFLLVFTALSLYVQSLRGVVDGSVPRPDLLN